MPDLHVRQWLSLRCFMVESVFRLAKNFSRFFFDAVPYSPLQAKENRLRIRDMSHSGYSWYGACVPIQSKTSLAASRIRQRLILITKENRLQATVSYGRNPDILKVQPGDFHVSRI